MSDVVVVVREPHTVVVGPTATPVVAVTSPGPQGPTVGVPLYLQEAEPPGPAIWFQTDALGRVIDIRTVDA